jgi:hypothetical protein
MIAHYGSSSWINLPVPAAVCGDGREWGGTGSNECNPAFALPKFADFIASYMEEWVDAFSCLLSLGYTCMIATV